MKYILLYTLCYVGSLTMSGRLLGRTFNPLPHGEELIGVNNLSAILLPGDQKVLLNWGHDLPEVQDFQIFRNGILIAAVTGAYHYVDSGFIQCTYNNYRVLALYNGNVSTENLIVSIDPALKIVDFTVKYIPGIGNKVTFTYSGPYPQTLFSLERSVDGISGINVLDFNSGTMEFMDHIDTGIYHYRVKSYTKKCTGYTSYWYKIHATLPLLYKRVVFSEMFSGENCSFGRYMEELQDAFTSDKQDSFIGIKYFMPWRNGAAKGHFYQDNSVDANARAYYYNVNAVPIGYINGTRMYVGASTANFELWKNKYYTDNSSRTPFRIEITQKINDSNSRIDFRIVVKCASYVTGNLKLRIAIVEKSLYFFDAPGSNGQIHFEDLMKKFIPDATGLLLKNNWMPNDSWVYENSWVFPKYMYNISSTRVLAFIQDDLSKYVHQAGVSKSIADPDLKNSNSPGRTEFALFPIPANDYVFVNMNLNAAENVNFRIANACGMIIQDLDHLGQEGNNLVRLDLSDLAAGIYFIHTTYSNYNETFRLVVQ